jgi:MFS family permease
VGLLLGGVLTQYLSWRWTLYVNLIFAGVSLLGGALLLKREPSPTRPRLDIPGVLLVSGAVFCLVYGFSNAATHSWATPSTYGFLAAGVALGVLFALWQGQAAHPLLPPRVVLDRNRGRLGRTVRDLLVLDLLPAADAHRVQPVHDRADAAGRA